MSSTAKTAAAVFNPQDKFLESVQNFLMALEYLYKKNLKKDPDDEESQEVLTKVQRWHSRLRTMVIDASDGMRIKTGGELVASFHTTMSPFYQRIMKMDPHVIFSIDHSLFTELDFKTIFSKSKPKVQTIMLKHLLVMCRNANLCSSTENVPAVVMSKIYGISAKMAEAQNSGKKPDMADIWKEATSIVHDSSKSDQMAIAKSMEDGGMQGLINMVMGGAVEGGRGGEGGGGSSAKTKTKTLSSKARKIRAKREKKRLGTSKLTGSKRTSPARATEEARLVERKRAHGTKSGADPDDETDTGDDDSSSEE
jgi:hypothetical protein